MDKNIEFDKVKNGYAVYDKPDVYERVKKQLKKLPNICVGDVIMSSEYGEGIVVSVQSEVDKSNPDISKSLIGVWHGERNHKKWKIRYMKFESYINEVEG